MKNLTYIMMALTAVTCSALVHAAEPANNWSRAVYSADPVRTDGFITDTQICKNFYSALQNDRILSDDTKRNVEIRVYNGKATIQGKVKDNKERTLVSNIAKRLQGVESVKSNLSTRS